MNDNLENNITTQKLGQLTSSSNVVTNVNATSSIRFPFYEWHLIGGDDTVNVRNYTINEIVCIPTEVYGHDIINDFTVYINLPTTDSEKTPFVEYYINISPINQAVVHPIFQINNVAINSLVNIAHAIDKPMAFHFYEKDGNFKVYAESTKLMTLF